MKAGTIIGFTFLALLVLLMGKCSVGMYQGFKDFPEYAKKEVLHVKYKDLLKSIDKAVETSDSYFSFVANVEKIEKPNDLIYFALNKNETKKGMTTTDLVEIVNKLKKSNSTSTSKVLINGTGYRQFNGQNTVIIEYAINKHDVKDCVMYFKDSNPRPTKD